MEPAGINGVDENSFSTSSFSTDAWEVFLAVVTALVSYWSGTAWVYGTLKVWDGVQWTQKVLRWFNGSTWV